MMSPIKLMWRPIIGLMDYSGPEDWAFESANAQDQP